MSLQIDNDLRTIAIPEDVTFLGVAGDKNVRVLEFTMPSTYGDIDLSDYDIVVNFKNIERDGCAKVRAATQSPELRPWMAQSHLPGRLTRIHANIMGIPGFLFP